MEELSYNRESQLWSNKLKIWSLFRSYQIICETCLLAAHMSVPPNLSGRRSQMMLAPNAYLTARSYYFQFPPRALSVVGWSSVTAPPPPAKEQPNYHSEVPLSKSMTSLQSAFQLAALLPAASQLFSTPALFDRDDPSAWATTSISYCLIVSLNCPLVAT